MEEPSGRDLEFLAELVGALTDGIVVIGPEGRVVWANQAIADLAERPLDEVVGSDAFALVHPDDLARAIDAIDYAQQLPGRAAVAPYRIRSGRTDRWLDVEVRSGVMVRPDGDHLTIMVRDASPRRAVNQALESVASGQPLATTVELVARAVMDRWPNTAVAVVLADPDGGHEVHSVGLAGALVEHARGEWRGVDDPAPWDLARSADPVVVVDAADLPPDLARAAADQGFAGFGVAPVAGDGTRDGCLIVWFDHMVVARLEFVHAARELTEVLAIALGRDDLHREMWQAARHDALTGLLNRYGFTEAFETCVHEARENDDVVAAALYVDLDGLKAVNDLLGHAAGDRVLAEVARRLDGLPEECISARLGGDEFAVVVQVPADDAAQCARDIADSLVSRLVILHDPPVSASIGLAIDDGEAAPLVLLERADAAMYRAKVSGKGRWSL